MESVDRINSYFSALPEFSLGGYGLYMKEALKTFAENDNKDTAKDIYTTFLDCYKTKLGGGKNFIDLLDTLRSYEENAALLIDKQRDHYVHSANVFLLGLEIYEASPLFKKAVRESLEGSEFPFSSWEEEFFFRWGMAALFHDIGYPIEITNNQIHKFVKVVLEDNKNYAAPFIGYRKQDSLTKIQNENTSLDFTAILSRRISGALNIEYSLLYSELESFIAQMQQSGIVDHGYYSTLAMLHRYSFMAEEAGSAKDIYEISIVDAASAILLHNYYKHNLRKAPFNLPPMKAVLHPVAYLLILCDELQEWNREAYGIVDRKKVNTADSKIDMDENILKIHYITYDGVLADNFSDKKEDTIFDLLEITDIFPGGIDVTTTTKSELYISNIKSGGSKILPRPFLSNIEQLSKRIHERYNENQKKTNPDKPLAYPTWDALSDDLKYSNIRQARTYFEKLESIGCFASDKEEEKEEIFEIPPELIEKLAKDEHDSWVDERMGNGWVYGPEKDVDKKISPYLVPYEALSEDIKQIDRDAVANIIPLFREIGLKVYKA